MPLINAIAIATDGLLSPAAEVVSAVQATVDPQQQETITGSIETNGTVTGSLAALSPVFGIVSPVVAIDGDVNPTNDTIGTVDP